MKREERRRFVRDHRTCVFGYNRQEHGPAMTVVYYVMDGDDMLISTTLSHFTSTSMTW